MKKWPSRYRDCLFYISIGYFKLGEYKKAKTYITSLLKIEPENAQAKSLLSSIEKKYSYGTLSLFLTII